MCIKYNIYIETLCTYKFLISVVLYILNTQPIYWWLHSKKKKEERKIRGKERERERVRASFIFYKKNIISPITVKLCLCVQN